MSNVVAAAQMYREVSRKAAVGERIKIVAAVSSTYTNGAEMTVISAQWPKSGAVDAAFNGDIKHVWYSEYVVLEPLTTAAPTPLSADPLYAAFRQFVADNADELRKLLPEIDPPGISVGGIVDTPFTIADASKPLTRAQVIAKATADVAELLRIGHDDNAQLKEDVHFRGRWFEVTFAVNREKRAVTALVYELNGFSSDYPRKPGGPHAKFTAKCSPADVFHAEIGKAIALRKALGLTVPSEYTDAPQPEKAQPGAVIRKVSGACIGETRVIAKKASSYRDSYLFTNGFNSNVKNCAILDDTDVDYGAARTEGAAA
ncbi:hypothetical protein [Paenibacillus graminis]|uniref:hypothetical protein n=1 Tax=Paenibacillus graminis TaxID=189425 RepID=UPI002DBE4F67|nr:hypothetical protein [Paenibacillus graminis]MEC0167893.1 hypothetical protein [Paenibacillus graminis]